MKQKIEVVFGFRYFGKLILNDLPAKDDDGRYCTICEKRYSIGTSSSNLTRHLLNSHQIDLKTPASAQKKVSDIFNEKFKPSTPSEKKQLLGRRLGLAMCLDSRPANHFATTGFRQLLKQVSGGGELKSSQSR